MSTDSAPLTRWGGLTEPMTVLTDVVLAALAFVLGVRLAYPAAADGAAASLLLAFALFATSASAALAGVAHGLDPVKEIVQRRRCWRAALMTTGFVGAAAIASVAFFAARGSVRLAVLVAAGLKLLTYLVRVARRPEFRVAALDYGGALAVVFAASLYAYLRWRAPGAVWLMASVAVSLLAGIVQARHIGLHRHFNHNDLYHVVEMAALYLLYRGGALLVDR